MCNCPFTKIILMLFKINTKNIQKEIKSYFVSTASDFKLQIFKKKRNHYVGIRNSRQHSRWTTVETLMMWCAIVLSWMGLKICADFIPVRTPFHTCLIFKVLQLYSMYSSGHLMVWEETNRIPTQRWHLHRISCVQLYLLLTSFLCPCCRDTETRSIRTRAQACKLSRPSCPHKNQS